ncbi:uncharacterized protein LOC129722490 [Wyeomyia smithii]|uniref:uncharacterized protein LOC129722490 n=1 Tax=Wyeomyia smithii TaxID=174621 RepID=UPI002467EC37|nr:uncharacterized protein LOC129722490 [Wyeomyia smithii]XP_055531916.1 uncharacterized protein LOC129722490 [Wyeomyia smithii]XP_055531918.1 uncharacterized protein LOC129722490 [Wyeomyia smithii]XP_055531919.1 uncharacterized protein LOC129722490 [Wyeomyia smithii]XP_055531920.1 uncharacterized protein LOC129722490 [Wyeomyia smithii]
MLVPNVFTIMEFPVTKRQSAPKISNIDFGGNFSRTPSEYRQCYRKYDTFMKSGPIKNIDNLCLSGKLDFNPEYKHRFQKPLSNMLYRSSYTKREDSLHLEGDFFCRTPEYFSSYQNPHITHRPEYAKPINTILHLEGNLNYEPLYRSCYINYPVRRPVLTKPESNIRLETLNCFINKKMDQENNSRKQRSRIPIRYHHNTEQELNTFTSQPEYRKAKRELLIKPRAPSSLQKSTLAQQILNEQHKIGMLQDGCNVSNKVINEDYFEASQRTLFNPKNHTFKLKVDNVDIGKNNTTVNDSEYHIKTSKASIQKQHDTIQLYKHSKQSSMRNQSQIVEANINYTSKNFNKICNDGSDGKLPTTHSFVVINAPIKQKNKHWLGPATIYDSQVY